MKKRNWPLLIGGILVVGIGAAIILYQLWQDYQSQSTYKALTSDYVKVTVETEPLWYEQGEVDFEELERVNSDVVGWIWLDGVPSVSYPILQGETDETYLHQDLYGQSLKAGSIFLESGNAADFTDCHSILYGHNMRDGSMFGVLKDYQEDGFYQEHRFFTIATAHGMYHYEIFGYEEVADDASIYTIGFGHDEQFGKFLREMQALSYENTGVSVTQDDCVITLSTCSTTGRRFVVHGVLRERRDD